MSAFLPDTLDVERPLPGLAQDEGDIRLVELQPWQLDGGEVAFGRERQASGR